MDRIHDSLKQEARYIAQGQAERTKRHADVEAAVSDWLIAKAYEANKKAIQDAERIESDFHLIDATLLIDAGKGRNKTYKVKSVWLMNGNVYWAEVALKNRTRTLDNWDERHLGFYFTNHKTGERETLAQVDMSPEEIGKAAHALDCIRSAFSKVIESVAPAAAA